MTNTPPPCPQCGAAIPPDAPAGGCPGCLLDVALDPEPPEGVPSRESLASLFPELEIQSILGHGGMGAVFRARQTKLDRVVALKVLPPQPGERGAAFADRFQREARALARLDHPSIVHVFEFGERDGLFFLVMEYVDGVNLREAMQDGDVAPRQALAIVPQICDALQYAHDNGVVHRDIKPENVLISKNGAVKVADFGLAKMLVGASEDATLTRAGQVMGTVHYMAPEQMESPASVDHRADIYSLGVVFYEMLTGELPVGRFEPPSHRARIDARLDAVVMRALERKRERRYQRASDVKTAVSGIDDPGSGGPVAASTPAATKLSIPGLLSLLALPVAFVAAPFAGGAISELGGGAHGVYVAMASTIGVLGLLAILFGIAGIVDTRSPLRTGRWMGVVGLVAALVWTPALASAAYYGLDVRANSQRERDEAFRRDQGRRLDLTGRAQGLPDFMRAIAPYQSPDFAVTAGDASSVPSSYGAALKARLDYLIAATASAIEANGDIEALVASQVLLRPENATAVRDGQRGAAHGLALLDPGLLGGLPLAGFRAVRAHVNSAMTPSGGLATARQGNMELTFAFAYDAVQRDWYLTLEPLGIARIARSLPEGVRAFNADGTNIAGGGDSGNVAQMLLRFSQWRGSPSTDDSRRALRRPVDREGQIDDAGGGLPYCGLLGDDRRSLGLRITQVRYTDASQMWALVTAESEQLRVTFPMVQDSGDWWFGIGHVNIEAQSGEDR